jgi:hypothetical protein
MKTNFTFGIEFEMFSLHSGTESISTTIEKIAPAYQKLMQEKKQMEIKYAMSVITKEELTKIYC